MVAKMYEREAEVMSVLWDRGENMKACDVVKVLQDKGWSYSTAYSMVRRCTSKGYIKRIEPDFVCEPLVSREEAYLAERESVFGKFFGSLLSGGGNSFSAAGFKNNEELDAYDRAKINELFSEFDKETERLEKEEAEKSKKKRKR